MKILNKLICYFTRCQVVEIERSVVLSKVQCVRCKRFLCHNREEDNYLPWELGFAEHFRLINQAIKQELK